MKHIIPGLTFPADAHTITDCADFSKLDALYEGREVCYGDYHAHSNSGGMSDGKTTPSEWLVAMEKLGIDFIGLMDHQQVRHMYLPEFDPKHFIYGTEPAAIWIEPQSFAHYLMLFKERDLLEKVVLEKFPEVYNFTGGVEGVFDYLEIERDKFIEICNAVMAADGMIVHAHPMQLTKSDKLSDYSFGDGTAIETIYTDNKEDLLAHGTVENYKLWMDMLDADMKVYNTASADVHRAPTNSGINTLYVAEKHCREYVTRLQKGDLSAGHIGIKMSLDDAPMGSTVAFKDGAKLMIKVGDAHPICYKGDEAHRLDVLSDQGLVCSVPVIDGKAEVCIEAQKRRFYRAVVIRETDGAPAAIGNPIWME